MVRFTGMQRASPLQNLPFDLSTEPQNSVSVHIYPHKCYYLLRVRYKLGSKLDLLLIVIYHFLNNPVRLVILFQFHR